MATGLRRGSAKSLGSFVDLNSAASSEFEPIDLEEFDSQSQEDMSNTAVANTEHSSKIVGKNSTPSLQPVRELTDSREQSGNFQQAADPLQNGLQDFEVATHKAAEMARDLSSKLSVQAAEARSSVLKLAGDVSSWWAALDPTATQQSTSAQNSATSAQGNEEIQELFGLSETEDLMEKFDCSLLQTMECRHNTFSKPQEVRIRGKLYITDKHTCFDASGVRFAILHTEIRKINKLPGNASNALELKFGKANSFVVLDSFNGNESDSALGLLEHLTA